MNVQGRVVQASLPRNWYVAAGYQPLGRIVLPAGRIAIRRAAEAGKKRKRIRRHAEGYYLKRDAEFSLAGNCLEVSGVADAELIESCGEEERRWLASIVAWSSDAIIGNTLDGIIVTWNKGAERILGYAAEEVIGKSIMMLIPADRHNEERMILKRIERGEPIEHYETGRQCKHGSLIVVSLCVSPVKNAEGRIVGASTIARDITERKRSEEQIAALARKAEHRTRNVLATVLATIDLSKSETSNGLKRAIKGRIEALANVLVLFVQSRWVGAELSRLAMQELAPYVQGDDVRAYIDGPRLLLEPETAQTMAVILHELATNAAKYGALSVASGHVEVKWSLAADGCIVVRWTERGGPPINPPTRRGFGTEVVEGRVRYQARGEVRYDWRTEGLTCEIVLPLSRGGIRELAPQPEQAATRN